MKTKNILPLLIVVAAFLSSCRDQIMEWEKRDPSREVQTSELPLELAEKISRYEALKTYTDFKLGSGVGLGIYMENETVRNLVNENFDEVAIGYAMKHGPMVQSDGSINYGPVDAMIAELNSAGLSLYGHTLCWHSNQNAGYLNGLIAPTVIPGAAGSNMLDNNDFETGDISPWGSWSNGGGANTSAISAAGEGLGGTGYAMVLVNPEDGSNWHAQCAYTLPAALELGKEYICSFWIKSSVSHSAFQFELQNPSYSGDYYGGISVGTDWTLVERTVIPSTDDKNKLIFDYGAVGCTYYIDDIVLTEAPENLVTTGDFEDGTLGSWGSWSNGGGANTSAVSADGEGYGDAGYAMVLDNPEDGSNWHAQCAYTFAAALEKDKEYTCSFWVKSSVAHSAFQFEIQNPSYSGDYYGGITVGTDWTYVEKTVTPSTDDKNKLIFDYGAVGCTYYIDDIEFVASDGGSGPTIIEKTEEEKTAIIEAALEDFISNMVTHYKDNVKAWDVVNEPIKDNGQLRDGNVSEDELSDDHFYWVKYIGQDYAVQAFNLARQYGNADDILFINDYNLESNLTKCDALINYVNYIESQGATVDGIGTQMHISANSDKDKIAQMFQKLAATGKLIKVSELDVRLGTANPTQEQLAEQAEMYKYVIDKYKELIPVTQQYGITIWGVSDNPEEHEYWLPDESPNIWDANYNRKHAYKGVADGLAGEDVSEGFSGELQY